MDVINSIPEKIWWAVTVIATLTSLYSILGRVQGKSFLSRHNWKVGMSETPPRSVSPEKDPFVSSSRSGSGSGSKSPASYVDTLPPQRREALSKMIPEGDVSTVLPYRNVDELAVRRQILPMKMDYRTCKEELYTPTGFSMSEIRALGDFPDYAALSGVRLPMPYREFDIETALPRPYRPFRWAYHQTMSLTKMESDWWLELENNYKTRIDQRKEICAKYGKGVFDYLPGSELACKELMEMVLQFLCSRYPQYFTLIDKRILRNNILQTEQDITLKHPLEILGENVPEDFAIMMRDDQTGNYFLRAGIICSALGWNVGTKIGLQLHQIHDPIPDYKEKMQFSMDRFFTKMPTDKPIQRGSWGLEVGKPLYMPPGDPHEKHRLSQDPNLRLEDCNLRVDWQTLRRLPLSGAVVFNFKALFTPVTEFQDEPCIPALLAKLLSEGKRNLMEYKNTWHVEHVVRPTFEAWAREQEDNGLVPKGWEVATLDESPWYKNWEEKWHRQQGF